MLLLCNYYVTYRCNAYCEFCHFGNHNLFKDTPYCKLEDFYSNVEQLSKLGLKFIDLTGGEPLLHPDIAEMAKFAFNHNIQTSLTTNGLLYSKFAEKLAGNINLLHFSLDSSDEDIHNKTRGVNCFKSVFSSINIAKSLGEFPDILFTVTNNTFAELPKIYDIAKKFELVLIVNPVFSYFGNEGLNNEAIDYIEKFVDGKNDIYINNAYLKLRKAGGNNINDPLCKAVSRVVVISPTNEIILPCYHFSKDTIKIDKPIKEIRQSEKIKNFMKMEGRFDFCSGCTINCYFEPSFAFPTNIYGLVSLSSKIKYGYNKLIKQKVMKRKFLNNSDKKVLG